MAHQLKQYIATVTDIGYIGNIYNINTGSIKLFESLLLQPQIRRHTPLPGISCSAYFYEKDTEKAKKLVHEALRLEIVQFKKEFNAIYDHFIHGIKN